MRSSVVTRAVSRILTFIQESHAHLLLDVTGPSDATKGVLIIFDIFGYYPQTLQGADILSSSDAKQKYQVFMPDWFKGEPCPIEMYVHSLTSHNRCDLALTA